MQGGAPLFDALARSLDLFDIYVLTRTRPVVKAAAIALTCKDDWQAIHPVRLMRV